MKRYLQCAEKKVSLPNLTKYCACHAKWLSKISTKFLQNRWNVIYNARPIRDRFEHDPTMIRPWNRQSATRLATEVTFRAPHEHFVLKNATFRAPAIIPNFTKYCPGHEKKQFNFTKYCTWHEKSPPNAAPLRLPRKETLELHQMLPLPRKMTVQLHQIILRLPRKVTLQLHLSTMT